MGLEVPSWAAEIFHILTGDSWPAADEEVINDLATLWLEIGNELMQWAPEVTRSARYLSDSGALVGEAQKALSAAVTQVTGDGDLTLEKLAAGFDEMGSYLHQVALQTQYTKIVVLEELIILAAQIMYLIAMIPWTFGASAGGIAALQLFGRAFAIAAFRELAIAITAGEVLQIGLDATAQLAQMAEGWRGSWDARLTKSAAITGGLSGALGPLFGGLGHYPGKLIAKSLGSVVGSNAGHEVGDWAAQVLKGAAHEYVTDGVSGLAQGQGWRPDLFSLTAGAADEGITSAASLGRRKVARSRHGPIPGLPGGSGNRDLISQDAEVAAGIGVQPPAAQEAAAGAWLQRLAAATTAEAIDQAPPAGGIRPSVEAVSPPRLDGIHGLDSGRLEAVPAMTPEAAQSAARAAVGELPEGPVREMVQRRLTDLLIVGKPDPGPHTALAQHAPVAADWPLLLDGGLVFLAGGSVIQLSGALTDLVPVTGPVPETAGGSPRGDEQAAGQERFVQAAVRLSLSVDGLPQAFDPVLPSRARVALPTELVPSAVRVANSTLSIDEVLRGDEQRVARTSTAGGQPFGGTRPGPGATPWSVAAAAASALHGVNVDDPTRARFLALVEEQQSSLGPAWTRWTAADPVVHNLLLIDAIDNLGRPVTGAPGAELAAGIPGVSALRTAAVLQARTALAAPALGPAQPGSAVDVVTRTAFTVLAFAERSPALADRMTTTLFDVAFGEQSPVAVPSQAPGSYVESALDLPVEVRPAVAEVVGGPSISTDLTRTPGLLGSAPETTLAAAARQTIRTIAATAVQLGVPQTILSAPASTPVPSPSVDGGTVTAGTTGAGTAAPSPTRGGNGSPPQWGARWWRWLFNRPVTVTWPAGNETLVDTPARSTVTPIPEYRPPTPEGDPVVAATRSMQVHARDLVRRALADPASLHAGPDRSRGRRTTQAVLPFLGAAPLRRVFALQPIRESTFSDDLPPSRSMVREAAREQVQLDWPEVDQGGGRSAQRSATGQSQRAGPDEVGPREGVPDHVDQNWHDQQLAALMGAAAVQRVGKTAVADLVSARAEVRQQAESVTAQQQSSPVVVDSLREQHAAVTADLTSARRERIRAERSWQQAVVHDQVTRTAFEHVSTQDPTAPAAPAFAAMSRALQHDAGDAQARREVAERAWRRAQEIEHAQREQLESLTAQIDDLGDRGHRVAIDQAAGQLRQAADTLDSAVRAATRVHRDEVRAMDRQEARIVEGILRHPPGFPADRSSAQLRSRLTQLHLELPTPASDVALPEAAVLRLVVDGLALVSADPDRADPDRADPDRADPDRADRLLAALMDHSSTDLIPAPSGSHSRGKSSASADARADLRALWREMADVKRGVEALAIVAQRYGSAPRGDLLDSLSVYWTADSTLQTLPSPVPAPPDHVPHHPGEPAAYRGSRRDTSLDGGEPSDAVDRDRQWLEAARRAAAHRLHERPLQGVGDRERAAFNGVSNGLLAVGPGSVYHEVGGWVHTLAEVWTQRAADRVAGVRAPLSEVVRLEGTTPLHPRLVRQVDRMGPAFGFATRGVLADRGTAAAARGLARYAQDRLAAALRAGRSPSSAELVAAAGAAWASGLPEHGLAQRHTTAADHPDLSAAVGEQVALARRTLAWQGVPIPSSVPAPDLHAAVQADLAGATARGESALGSLRRWASALAPPDGSGADTELRDVKIELEEALRFGADHGGKVGDRAGLVDFLDPMLAEWDVRQGLRLVQGRSVGLALPVPWYLRAVSQALTFGVMPVAEVSHRRDVFLEIQYPSSMGIHIAVGRQRATAGSLGATIAWLVTLPSALKLGLGLGVTARVGTASGEGLLLRFPRVRGQEQAARRTAREVLDELAFWDSATDEAGRPFDDPLQFMLSRHADLTVTPLNVRQSVTTVDASLRAALAVGITGAVSAGPQLVLGASAERVHDYRTERTGQLSSAHDRTSTATQRIRLTVGAPTTIAGQALSTDTDSGGQLVNPALPLPTALSRELYQRLERRRINDMRIGRTGEADFDRVTDDPAPLLSETAANELGWISRGMSTMEGIPAELMPTFGRDLARARIQRFRHELQHLGRTTKHPSYTVRYSRQPQAQTHLDITDSLAAIARRRRDQTTAHRWAATRDSLLLLESTWMPRTVFARDRGSRTRTRGLAFLLRGQTYEQIEVNRTAAQFPPP
jgi:hypothetical protein